MSTLVKYKTCKRWNEPGDAHFLTFSCYRRYPLLTRNRTRQWLIDALERARRRHSFDLWAYVIMPDHVHIVVRPQAREYDVSAVLKAIKWPVSIQARRFLEARSSPWLARLTHERPGAARSFHFWQRGGGFDRNVRHERTLGAMIEYIHANPVRRELVSDPLDWPWSSARWYDGARDVPIQMDDTII